MSDENKNEVSDDLKAKALELGKFIYEGQKSAQEEAAKKEAELKAKKVEEEEKAVTKVYNMKAINASYGISDNAFDNMVEKDFHPQRVSALRGIQKDPEKLQLKSTLFMRALVGMKLYPHVPEFAMTVKALSEGTDADGGFLVDPEFRGEVIRQVHLEGVMRPNVNIIPTTKDSVQFNKEDGRPIVSWGSENTSISTTTAGLAQTTINVHRMNTRMYLSREVVADSDPSILEWIRAELATAVRLEEDAVLIGGSGTGRPKGLTQLTLTSNAAGASHTFEDWVDLEHTLPVQYRNSPNVKAYMNDLTLRDARKLKDDQGMPIFLRNLDGTAPGTILGYPVVVHNNFPEGTVFFGDLKRAYFMLDRQQMAMETSTEADDTFAKHQVQIKVTERIGGDSVRSEALVKGTGYSA